MRARIPLNPGINFFPGRAAHMFLSVSSPMSPLLPSVDPQEDTSTVPCTFEPSIAVVVGLLAALLSMTFILVVYAQHCKRISNRIFRGRNSSNLPTAPLRLPPARFYDIDNGLPQRVIDSLPTFLFSDLRGLSKQGLDCAVCLCKYEESDVLRLLPRCKHAFHVACVDKWLVSRPSCPLCRRYLSSEDVVNVGDLILQRDEPTSNLNAAAANAPAAGLQVVVESGSSADSGGTHEEECHKQDASPMQPPLSSIEHSSAAASADNADDEMGAMPQRRRCRIVVSDVLMQHRWSDFVRADVSLDLLQPEEPCDGSGSADNQNQAGAMKRSPSLNALSKRSKPDVILASASSTKSQSEHHEEHRRWIKMVQRTVNLVLRRDMEQPDDSSLPVSTAASSSSESRDCT